MHGDKVMFDDLEDEEEGVDRLFHELQLVV